MPIQEIYLNKAIEGLEFSMDQFIDLCILLGCDYCDSIRGIGPKRAIELIRNHNSIDNILKVIDAKKYTVPENWIYKSARELFKKPEITDPESLTVSFGDDRGCQMIF